MQDALFNDLELGPGFPAPHPGNYEDYKAYIEEQLPPESPYLFGLHPNAEIGFLTEQAEGLFKVRLIPCSCAFSCASPYHVHGLSHVPLETVCSISLCTVQSSRRSVFSLQTILELQPKDSAEGGAVSRDEKVSKLIDDIQNIIPENFDMPELYARAQERSVCACPERAVGVAVVVRGDSVVSLSPLTTNRQKPRSPAPFMPRPIL